MLSTVVDNSPSYTMNPCGGQLILHNVHTRTLIYPHALYSGQLMAMDLLAHMLHNDTSTCYSVQLIALAIQCKLWRSAQWHTLDKPPCTALSMTALSCTRDIEVRCVDAVSRSHGNRLRLLMILQTPVAVGEWEEEERELLQDVVSVHSKVRPDVGSGHEPVNLHVGRGTSRVNCKVESTALPLSRWCHVQTIFPT